MANIMRIATRFGFVGVALGLACGVLYSVGGFFVDLFTMGLNWGTVLAFGALVGMPAVFGAVAFALGALFAVIKGAIQSEQSQA